MNIIYDCHIPEVMGYPERGYCFRRSEDGLLMWEGYFSDLMRGMWTVYGWEPDPAAPNTPNLEQVPLLREWNQRGWIAARTPFPILELKTTAKAFREAVAELRRTGPTLEESPQHGEALAGFLEQAASFGESVSVVEWWGAETLDGLWKE